MAVGRPAPLSDRERQVIVLIADGLPLKAIAARLGDISVASVDCYRRRAQRKLGVTNRYDAVRKWAAGAEILD